MMGILRIWIEHEILLSFYITILSSCHLIAFPSYKIVAHCSSIYVIIVILIIYEGYFIYIHSTQLFESFKFS